MSNFIRNFLLGTIIFVCRGIRNNRTDYWPSFRIGYLKRSFAALPSNVAIYWLLFMGFADCKHFTFVFSAIKDDKLIYDCLCGGLNGKLIYPIKFVQNNEL